MIYPFPNGSSNQILFMLQIFVTYDVREREDQVVD
jgi:hypothetical protein